MSQTSLSAPIPLTVVAGFLGAGKTSLLTHCLQQAQGQRIALLVNDFGELNIDAEWLSTRNSDTLALSNGCVCCQIGGDLSQALLQVLDNPRPFDAILIEASGVSDPWPIAQVALADKRLSLHGVWVLVDAQAVRQQAADALLYDTLMRQLRAADVWVVNKTDLCSAAQLQDCTDWLRATLGPVPCVYSQHGRLPQALLHSDSMAGPATATEPVHACTPDCNHDHADGLHTASDHTHHHAGDHASDHGALFVSDCRSPETVFHTDSLRAQLQATPPWVMRLKGWVRTHEHGWSEVQFAGRHASVRRARHVPSQSRVLTIAQRSGPPAQALQTWLDAVFQGPGPSA